MTVTDKDMDRGRETRLAHERKQARRGGEHLRAGAIGRCLGSVLAGLCVPPEACERREIPVNQWEGVALKPRPHDVSPIALSTLSVR